MAKTKGQRPKTLASLIQSNRLFYKVITAGAPHFLDVSFFQGKQAARIWSVLVDAAERGAIGLLLQERTFEEQFAASPTSIAVTTPERKGGNHLPLAKVSIDQASNLSLDLSRTQPGIFDFA